MRGPSPPGGLASEAPVVLPETCREKMKSQMLVEGMAAKDQQLGKSQDRYNQLSEEYRRYVAGKREDPASAPPAAHRAPAHAAHGGQACIERPR